MLIESQRQVEEDDRFEKGLAAQQQASKAASSLVRYSIKAAWIIGSGSLITLGVLARIKRCLFPPQSVSYE